MRAIAGFFCAAVGLIGLTGCDEPLKAVPSGFAVSKGRDPLDGDITTAKESFTNTDGFTAQVTLKCVADAKAYTLSQVQDLSDVNSIYQQIYSGAWSDGLAGTGIQFGCPEGFQCAVVAHVAFLTPDRKSDTPITTNQAQHPIVIYESKNAASASEQFFVPLEHAGSSYDDKAVDFLIPTEGGELSMWFYRFPVKGDRNPVEAVVDYSTPALVGFLQACNSRLPQQPDPGATK